MNLSVYWQVWLKSASAALQATFVNRYANIFFIFGKAIRFGMQIFFLLLIQRNVAQFSGYTTDQMIVFFLTFQLVDILGQIAYRGVYNFTNLVRSGEFDGFLSKPLSPLFRALTGEPDFNDVLFLFPLLAVSGYILSGLSLDISLSAAIWYGVLLLNSFLIATAFHIFILVAGIVTLDVDGIMWLYRDISRLGQIPINVYTQPLRFILFFLIPIGMMTTLPAQALIGAPMTVSAIIGIVFGVGTLLASYWSWRWALKQYTSASS